jgi:hypothetical protein
LCGSFRCGCGVTTDGSISISGSGEPDDPYRLSIGASEWITATYLNDATTVVGYRPARYRRVGDRVEMEGDVVSAGPVTMFVLPEDMRPPVRLLTESQAVIVNTDGTVVPTGFGQVSVLCSFSVTP